MKRHKTILIGVNLFVLGLLLSPVYADDLLQVYEQAQCSDPIFAQAESTWGSQKMNLPIARAGYLTQLDVAANADRNFNHSSSSPAGASGNNLSNVNQDLWQYGYSLTLTQPLFNLAVWSQIKGASAAVKSATATYLAAQESLMQRTVTAYFSVLQAYDQLRYIIANKRAVWQQFATAREQFKVGLIAITDEYTARSSYDQAVAQQITAQNNLNIQLENLRALTGRDYRSLKGLGKRLPLSTPQPNNIDQWVAVALAQNYDIKAQNFAVIAAMEKIKQIAAGGYPSVNLEGGYSESHHDSTQLKTEQDTADVGLALDYKPIQGGFVMASTRQARYDYVTASGKLEQTHRAVVNQTRSGFLSVLSGVSQVQADKQTIISNRNSLSATQAGFHVGTRTMVDVLNALSTLYQAQQRYADDRYAYINNLVSLKIAAGTLSLPDLVEINSWLGKSIVFPLQTSVAHISENNSDRQKKPITKAVLETPIVATRLSPPERTMLPGPATT